MNKLIITAFAICLFVHYSFAQSLNKIISVGNGLHYMLYDSSESKSTIIEFKQYIALLEVPIEDKGGGAQNLQDHISGGEKVLATLKSRFPKKPLRYVMHSHWHPHSISAVKPFLEYGATLITTPSNFEKLQTFVDPVVIKKYQNNITLVETDSMVIQDSENKIITYSFKKEHYPNTPTQDYLYFYLPKYKSLHTGCMYNRWEGELVNGKEIRTGREEDLNKFLTDRSLAPAGFIRLHVDYGEKNHIIPYNEFDDVIKNGISGRDLVYQYLNLDKQLLVLKRDSLLQSIISGNIPSAVLNTCVYQAFQRGDLLKALCFAEWQVLVAPHDANAWDTLGEANYFLDRKNQAQRYAAQAKLLDPRTEGGEAAWEKDLQEYRKQWK